MTRWISTKLDKLSFVGQDVCLCLFGIFLTIWGGIWRYRPTMTLIFFCVGALFLFIVFTRLWMREKTNLDLKFSWFAVSYIAAAYLGVFINLWLRNELLFLIDQQNFVYFFILIIAAVSEELLLRSALTRILVKSGISDWSLIFISSAIFMAIHFRFELSFFTAGGIFILLYLISRSLMPVIFVHAVWNLIVAFNTCHASALVCVHPASITATKSFSPFNLHSVLTLIAFLILFFYFYRNQKEVMRKFRKSIFEIHR